MRAIALRSRIARGFRAPTEEVVREYHVDGSVRAERVRTAQGWKQRASTLPTELASRPLHSFVQSSSIHSVATMVPQTLVSVDTVDSTPITNIDTVWAFPSWSSNVATRESSAGGFSWIGDIYYTGPGDVGAIELSASGIVVTEIPADDGFLEATLNSTDWGSAKAEVMLLDDFPGWPGAGGQLRANIPSPATVATVACAFGLMADEDPCASFRYSAIKNAASGLISGVAGIVSAYVFPPAVPWFTRGAVISTGLAAFNEATYRECKRPKP